MVQTQMEIRTLSSSKLKRNIHHHQNATDTLEDVIIQEDINITDEQPTGS